MNDKSRDCASSADAQNLTSVLDQLAQKKGQEDSISISDLLIAFNSRVYGPLILIAALLAIAPTGAIPGMSMLTGLIIFTLSAQLLVRRPHPWLPRRLREFKFARTKLDKTIVFLRPYTDKIDRYVKPRLPLLFKPPILQLSALICMLLSLLFFPLALLPFAVMLPAFPILIIALGLTSRDGIFLLSGLVLSIGVVTIVAIKYL